MHLGWLTGVTAFALVMSITPGPNNTMVTASGANFGLARSLPHMAGISLGVGGIILAVSTLGSPLLVHPAVHGVLKWVGISYLLWLAARIATARPAAGKGEAGGRPLTVVEGALFQLVNPKFWVMAAGAIAAYGGTASGMGAGATGLVFAAVFGVSAMASTMLWTLVGVGAGRLLVTDRAMRRFNYAMAALLVASLIPAILE